ncbi:MAG: serine hydrolase [Planctomycetes bacterium]|nr:serine hydrolase [Planctomycetota bacterium]
MPSPLPIAFVRACFAALLAATVPCQALPDGRPDAHGFTTAIVDDLRVALRDRVARGESAGTGVVVVHDGAVVLRETAGELRLDQAVRADAMAAPVVAIAALIAVERGFVRLDDAAATWLREPSASSAPGGTLGELLARRGDALTLASKAVEGATQVEWGAWVTHELFGPLGLRRAAFTAPAESPAGRRRSRRAPQPGFEATPDELAALAWFVVRGGAIGERCVLTPDSIARLCGDPLDAPARDRGTALAFRRERVADRRARTLVAAAASGPGVWIDRDRRLVVVIVERSGRRRASLASDSLMPILRRALPLPDDGLPRAFDVEGPWAAEPQELTRFERLPYPRTEGRRFAPVDLDDAPTVIVLDDDRAPSPADDALDAHWASHGFSVLRLELRADAKTLVHEPGAATTQGGHDRRILDARSADLRTTPAIESLLAPARRVTAALDAAAQTRGNAVERIVVVGAGLRAIAALALGGVELVADGRRIVARDPRVVGVIAIGAPGAFECGLTPGGLAALSVPAVFVTGAPDSRAGSRLRFDRELFDTVPVGDKFLVDLQDTRAFDADPFAIPWSIPGADPFWSNDGTLSAARRALLAGTTAFLVCALHESDATFVADRFARCAALRGVERK